ncbi:unnamed protein product [Pleuronectes platessa]|uniref:Uncharacterized protein n=1 Tax=Pleuronectes platessa TaxID=8262 RepID=A0A9N7U1Y3_PLEPL|nr:unnamed protein product [Pleuronectes platessa]
MGDQLAFDGVRQAWQFLIRVLQVGRKTPVLGAAPEIQSNKFMVLHSRRLQGGGDINRASQQVPLPHWSSPTSPSCSVVSGAPAAGGAGGEVCEPDEASQRKQEGACSCGSFVDSLLVPVCGSHYHHHIPLPIMPHSFNNTNIKTSTIDLHTPDSYRTMELSREQISTKAAQKSRALRAEIYF